MGPEDRRVQSRGWFITRFTVDQRNLTHDGRSGSAHLFGCRIMPEQFGHMSPAAFRSPEGGDPAPPPATLPESASLFSPTSSVGSIERASGVAGAAIARACSTRRHWHRLHPPRTFRRRQLTRPPTSQRGNTAKKLNGTEPWTDVLGRTCSLLKLPQAPGSKLSGLTQRSGRGSPSDTVGI